MTEKLKIKDLNPRLAMMLGLAPDTRNWKEQVDDELMLWTAAVKYGIRP